MVLMKQFRVSRVYFEREASICYDSVFSWTQQEYESIKNMPTEALVMVQHYLCIPTTVVPCVKLLRAAAPACSNFILIIQIITNQYPNTDVVEKLVVSHLQLWVLCIVFEPVLNILLHHALLWTDMYPLFFYSIAPADAIKPVEGGHRHHRCSAASAGSAGRS